MKYPERASTRIVGYGGCYERILAYRQLTTTRLDTTFVPAARDESGHIIFFCVFPDLRSDSRSSRDENNDRVTSINNDTRD
jgi:hypothetical protein